jgi:hypothetical protein
MGNKKRAPKILAIYLAVFIGLVCCCNNSSAYEVTMSGGGAEIKWAIPNATYFVNPSGGPSNSLTKIQAAARTWTDVGSSAFVFVYGGTTTSTSYGVNDRKNTITFGFLGGEALAQNTFWYNTGSGEILDSDIRFNSDYLWNTSGSSSGYDVQNACTHELGHSLSLDDLYGMNDVEKTMYGYISVGEIKKRTLDPDDIAGICYLYPDPNVEYSLSVHAVGQGGITLYPDGGVYAAGTNVNLTAVAEQGWVFTSWSGNLNGSENPDTVTMNDNKDITANFDPAPHYTLAIETIGQGSVTIGPDDLTYIAGTLVELTATADPGWVFSKWSGDLISSKNSETITMNSDKDITATFIPAPQYTLTIKTIGEGDVQLDPDGGTYEAGTVVELRALPSADVGKQAVFVGWSGDLSGSDSPKTIAVDANKTISAKFLQAGTADAQLLNISYVDPGTIDNTRGKPGSLPYGLMEMEIETNSTGETATVTIYLPRAAPADHQWYKYTSSGSWLNFAREVISGGTGDGAVFNSDRTEVTLYITDNGPYDDDPREMVIRDPSGLGFVSSNSTVRTSSSGGGGGGCFIAAMAQWTP